MLYAIPYNHPAAIPVGILVVYVTLFIVGLFLKYAMLLWPEGSQQADLAIQEDSSSTESTPKRSQSSDELFRSNSGSPGKSSVSRGDSVSLDVTRATKSNDSNMTGTINNSSAKDQNCKEHSCKKLPQDCDGTAPGPSEKGHLSLQGGNSKCDRLHESGATGQDPKRSQPPAHRGLNQAVTCQPDQSNCANV